MILCFFTQKLFFGSKHLWNTIETLLNQLMAMKNVNNRPKTWNAPKKIPKLKYIFLICFQGKQKHIILTPLNIWNHFTQKIIILVVGFLNNEHLFSLSKNLTTYSLFSDQKRTGKWVKWNSVSKLNFVKFKELFSY
jgi:hypothetical protein